MLRVSHGILDNVLKERLENGPGLFVDQARDTLDAAT